MKRKKYMCPSCGKEGIMDEGGSFFCDYCDAFCEE